MKGSIPALFKTTVIFADARELPDAASAAVLSSLAPSERSFTLPSASTETLNLIAYRNPLAVYRLATGGRTVALDQEKDNVVTLRRIDVDNLRITREDGSVYTLPGSYELFFGGQRVAGPFKTNTGLDVLPGVYELVQTYVTAEGTKVQRKTITL